jgi:hypothetical protein
MLRPRADGRHHFVNAARAQAFTSQSGLDLRSLGTINDLFRGEARQLLRDFTYGPSQPENAVLVIGSPRIEVGVDLSRVMDGITYRAMRDPSSLQQKVGRVGRESNADSVIVHLVTQNARDQYYFRNPQIALDPDYLQALPLHEDNRIVARHHLLMAIVDFLCLQGANPPAFRIGESAQRLALINDHAVQPSFAGWYKKVSAAYDYLFGHHPSQAQNLNDLRQFLTLIGGQPAELERPEAAVGLTPFDAPLSRAAGVIDVFRHELGPNFLQTPLPGRTVPVSLAQLCSFPTDPLLTVDTDALAPTYPRHVAFLRTLTSGDDAGGPNPYVQRSYLRDLMTQPVFRRGVPARNIPADHPFVWTPNLFETIGTETVRIFDTGNPAREKGYESVSAVLSLLAPGTVTYRYGPDPSKVPVSQSHATGQPVFVAPGIQAVRLNVDQPQFFEPAAGNNELSGDDLPRDYVGSGSVRVFTPRQLALIPARSEPLVTRGRDGLLADNDERPVPLGAGHVTEVMTPPRSYSLRWFRVREQASSACETRFQRRLRQYSKASIPDFPLAPVLNLFSTLRYDARMAVTDYVWGLDRQFMSRDVEPARLVYRGQAPDGATFPVALGHNFVTPALIFSMPIDDGTPAATFLDEMLQHPESVVFQAVLLKALTAFLAEFARLPVDPAQPWLGGVRPSVFTVRNLRTIVLFHLLRQWHPPTESGSSPGSPPQLTIDAVAKCFRSVPGTELDHATFHEICGIVASVRQPPSVSQHTDTLLNTWANFLAARDHPFNASFVRSTALDLLLNSLGIAMHAAALRQTGAETRDLAYFYKRGEGTASVFLFDTDPFGNGTVDLVRDNLTIPASERMLAEKLRLFGHPVDPLPSKDFAQSLEEELLECDSSQAAHLAYHNSDTDAAPWRHLTAECSGERRRVGPLYDFLRESMNIPAFDHLAALQECPEFLAHASARYPCYKGVALVGSSAFPVFQALESALGFCLDGCVACVISPESNLHGSLSARESVSKTLLDAFYRRVVVEAGTALSTACYPATGPSRTCAWGEQGRTAASALGRDAGFVTATLLVPPARGGEPVVLPVSASVTDAGEHVVFRLDWSPAVVPPRRVRVHMSF